MKRLYFSAVLLLCTIMSFGQTREFVSTHTVDYSQFTAVIPLQSFRLTNVAFNEYFTGIFMDVIMNSNEASTFIIPENAYISGDFGTMYPIGLTVDGKEWKLGKPILCGEGHKLRKYQVIIYYNRIPAGVSEIAYTCTSHRAQWTNIPIADNPDPVINTQWNEQSLRDYWNNNKCSSIEGIYCFDKTSDKQWWGSNKHTLAVIKDGYQYNIIYLSGSYKNIWKEGDVKATFIATATPGLYKANTWYMDNKLENENFFVKFKEGYMSAFENDASVSVDFLKLYPAIDYADMDDIPSMSVSIPNPSSPQDSPVGSGSGIFVGNKVIATNFHVIDGAKKIEVSIKTGNEIYTYVANVLSTDKTNDLALLKIDDEKFQGIGAISYAITPRTRDVGTSIFTMGYPMAQYMGEEVKITDGIISSKTGFEGDIVTYQISAPVQPGNSGGPLFDKNGYLIGITNASITAAQNVGYAIKSSYLFNIIESAPISISINEESELTGKELTEQIKLLSKYVVFIKKY